MNNIFFILFAMIFFSCTTSKKTTSQSAMIEVTDITTLLREKTAKEVDFFAMGNESSSWSLEIDFDKSMHFKTNSGIEIITPAVKGVKAEDADVTRYHAKTEQGILTVQLIRKSCTNTILGTTEYKVLVITKKNTDKDYQEFSGCGKFIGN